MPTLHSSSMGEMGMPKSSPRSYGSFIEESLVKNVRRSNNISHVTPSNSPPASFLSKTPFHPRSKHHFSDESRDDSNHSYDCVGRLGMHRSTLSFFDHQSGEITISFNQIMDEGLFETFVKDKSGCHFLQENFPEEGSIPRYRLFELLEMKEEGLEGLGFFEELCKDVFANFFVQKMIEKSTPNEQIQIAMWIGKSMFSLCMNRYSCRVIQKVIEHLPDTMTIPLVNELRNGDLVMLTVDQNANHVVQKIFHSFDLSYWSFIITDLLDANFFFVVENKYGCRVIQLAIESLAESKNDLFEYSRIPELGRREKLLAQIMEKLVENCERLSSNEFANYVIQHVITADCLAVYRDIIIEKCLLCHLLSLSQEKFASHVVEKALEHASSAMLTEMMDELFDGYVPHSATKKDAIDILLFHQYGNYVVQRMFIICSSKTEYRLDDGIRGSWMLRLQERINRSTGQLMKYSSGKKILDMLRAALGQPPINHGVTQSTHRQSQYNHPKHHYHHSHNTPLTNPRIPDQYR